MIHRATQTKHALAENKQNCNVGKKNTALKLRCTVKGLKMEGGSCIVFFTHVARSAGEMARKKTIKTRSSQLADLKNGVVVVRTARNIAKVSQRTASPRTRIGSVISESLAHLGKSRAFVPYQNSMLETNYARTAFHL